MIDDAKLMMNKRLDDRYYETIHALPLGLELPRQPCRPLTTEQAPLRHQLQRAERTPLFRRVAYDTTRRC